MAFTGPFEDRVMIQELMNTYADAISRVDATAYAACWADQGAQWSTPWYPDIGTVEGKDNIMAVWVEAMKVFAGDHFHMWPGSIEVNGDRAAVTAYTSEVFVIGDTVHRDAGYYEDECIKVNGQWYFLKRTFWLKHRETSAYKEEDRAVVDMATQANVTQASDH